MISPKSSTILDKIKKEYEYAIDPLDFENINIIMKLLGKKSVSIGMKLLIY